MNSFGSVDPEKSFEKLSIIYIYIHVKPGSLKCSWCASGASKLVTY
jgi:hypothetical protein